MVGLTMGAGAGDGGLPVSVLLVESAERISTLGNCGPWFVGSGDMGHEAACRERNATILRGLSLCHTETARLFGRGK